MDLFNVLKGSTCTWRGTSVETISHTSQHFKMQTYAVPFTSLFTSRPESDLLPLIWAHKLPISLKYCGGVPNIECYGKTAQISQLSLLYATTDVPLWVFEYSSPTVASS